MDLREQLQAIYDEHGRLTPRLLVEIAKPVSHPLHDRIYDRNQKDAASAWYLHRAHELIQSVRVVYKEGDEHTSDLAGRGFLAVRSEGPDRYVYEPAHEVAQDPFKRTLVLREMEREWRALHRRYEAFEEFVAMVRATLDDQAA